VRQIALTYYATFHGQIQTCRMYVQKVFNIKSDIIRNKTYLIFQLDWK